jgi:ribosomal protein S12 methylthiotransferase
MLDFVKNFKFDRLGVFTYSHEDNTYAANLPDKIPYKEKLRRQKLLLEAQRENSIAANEKSVGGVTKVLIDRKENDYYIGRSYKDAPEIDQEIFVNSVNPLKTGEFYKVQINDFEEFDLFGEAIN